MNLLLACHPIFHSDDWGYQRERAVGLLVSSAGAQAAGQRSSPRTLAVHSRSFFYKKCEITRRIGQVLVLVSLVLTSVREL
jgi:hypothetical protein